MSSTKTIRKYLKWKKGVTHRLHDPQRSGLRSVTLSAAGLLQKKSYSREKKQAKEGKGDVQLKEERSQSFTGGKETAGLPSLTSGEAKKNIRGGGSTESRSGNPIKEKKNQNLFKSAQSYDGPTA